jgi:hypothetical protein
MGGTMKRCLLSLPIFLILLLQTGCLYAFRYDGPYHGKVVDQETREPIEGAVVLGTWYTIQPSVAGGVSYYYDARETVTDKEGDFTIPGHGLRIMSNLEPMSVLIFKAGYSYAQEGTWDTLKKGLYSKNRIKWEGDKPVFSIRKLTIEERKKQIVPSPPHGAKKETIRLMVDEINKDLSGCGQGSIKIGR